MAKEKNYFKVKDLFEAAVNLAKTDPRYEEHSKICALDYDLCCSSNKNIELRRCEFDVVGMVSFGCSEGIYGDIFLSGRWENEVPARGPDKIRVYVLKTLKTDKEAYIAIGMLVNLICFYANEIVATNLVRFD